MPKIVTKKNMIQQMNQKRKKILLLKKIKIKKQRILIHQQENYLEIIHQKKSLINQKEIIMKEKV